MTKTIIITFIFIVSWSTMLLHGQYALPQNLIAKANDGKIQLRWEPQDNQEWFMSQVHGFDLTIKDLTTNTIVQSTKVKALSASEFKTLIRSIKNEKIRHFYTTSRDVLYPEDAEVMDIETMIASLYKPQEGTGDSLKINMLSYFSIFDSQLAQANGMGYTFKYPREGNYEATIGVKGATRTIRVDTREKAPKLQTQLISEFSNRITTLGWETKEHIGKLFGYVVEKSEDGFEFEAITDLPIIIPVPEKLEDYSGYLGYQDSLDVNYKDYYYRIRGFDFFGDQTGVYSATKGYGFDLIKSSPLITFADQENDNDAKIDWTLRPEDMHLVDYFRLMRSDSLEGSYHVALDSLAKEVRTLQYPMEYTENHFRIEAVPIDGNPVSSFPVFIMGMDTIPPATPTVISATIDSLGHIEIKWNLNHEPDMWGYRIFKANFGEQEYGVVNKTVEMDTVFIDSTHLNMGIDKVFYMVEACDTRNNTSVRTKPIIIEKPDIMPPTYAAITSLKQAGDSLLLHWSPSPSKDVIVHRIFRRALKDQSTWTLVEELDSSEITPIFIDPGLTYDVQYGYTIIAQDDVGLQSEPAEMKARYLLPPKEIFVAINSFEGELIKAKKKRKKKKEDEIQRIELAWAFNEPEDIDKILLYRGWEEGKLGRYKYLDAESTTYTEEIADTENVYYQIRPIYKNREGNYFSDMVELSIPQEQIDKK